jgi:hypothetical protein
MARSSAEREMTSRQKKVAYVQAYKLERGCFDCGYRESAYALDLDHRDPTHKNPQLRRQVRDHRPRAAWSLSWENLLAELPKCDVVCANCHRIRTYERRAEVA